jgi:uncharacterized oxidoreductase
MKMTGNTILVTGGGTGIGRGLAEAFHNLGNKVIVTGRRKSALDATIAANPGMDAMTLDVADPQSIAAFATNVAGLHPDLNVVIHNAGIMRPENLLATPVEIADAEATIATNLLGPIRLTAALLPHLRAQKSAAIMTVSSGLAFLPLAMTPTYSATKAAIHSYSQSLRYQLRDTSVRVFEIAPPYVQTELMGAGQASDPRAMPLQEVLDETIALIAKNPAGGEILVERVKPLRFAERGENYQALFTQFNDQMH